VAVTIVRAEENRLLVSLDRPSYLAVFDIVPGRGVTLLYPTSARQQQVRMVGARWLDPRWGTLNRYDAATSGRYARNDRALTHYVYAVASDRPLRLSSAAYDDDMLANVLGIRASWVDDPYDTRDAIVRQFVPATRDEDWGEDMYTMEAMRAVQVVRVARIYCPDGSVMYVREEMFDRALCPRVVASRGSGWGVRPDSVVTWNGRRVSPHFDPNSRTPVYRIPRTVGGHNVGQTAEGRDDDNDRGRGNGRNGGNVDRGNNGNNGNRGNSGSYGDRGNNGNNGNNGNHYGWENGNNGRGNGNSNGNAGSNGDGNSNGNATDHPVNQGENGVQQQGQPQGNPPGNGQGNSNGNANGNANSSGNSNAHGNGNGNGNAQGNANGNGNAQNHGARPESQPASTPTAAPDSTSTSKPASMSDILKRGKKPAPAKKAPAKAVVNRAPAPDSAKAPAPM
jgi:hypothetical protein